MKNITNTQKIFKLLNNYDIRAHIDVREKAGRKIRDAEISKTPFMLIVGEKEQINTKSRSKNMVQIWKYEN